MALDWNTIGIEISALFRDKCYRPLIASAFSAAHFPLPCAYCPVYNIVQQSTTMKQTFTSPKDYIYTHRVCVCVCVSMLKVL